MSPEDQKRWQEFDERLAEAEKRLIATANLVRAGIPMIADQQERIKALIDSEAKHYLHLQQVDERLARATEIQQRTDERLDRLAESQQRTDEKVNRLAESIQKLVDSWKTGNGAGNPHS